MTRKSEKATLRRSLLSSDASDKKAIHGNSLAVQWLGLHAFTAEGLGSIPGRGTEIPQAVPRKKKKNSLTQEGYR